MASRRDDAAGATVVRWFTLLHALRWLPTGLAAPVLTLLPDQRGLGLGQIGAAFALYGAIVIVLIAATVQRQAISAPAPHSVAATTSGTTNDPT